MGNNSWVNKWCEDIEVLKNTLIKNHKNLFFNITREEFEESIENLKLVIEKLDYNDMKVEISRIIAGIGDSHTAVKLPIKNIMPLEFYWFKEGLYVIKALGQYKELEYCKVIEINNISIDEVIEELKQIISHENQYYLKANIVKYIQAFDILYGLMIIDSLENCSIKFETLNGEIKSENINSIEIGEYNKLINKVNEVVNINNEVWDKYKCKENLKVSKTLVDKIPLYRKNSNRNYWFEYLKEEKLIYFKYNVCKEEIENPIDKFINKIIKCIEENSIDKLVVDLRNNSGGDSRLLESFIEYIEKNEEINKPEKLFVVIGRDTFSSGLLNAFSLKNNTKAILIGEPTGGKPNCYGEIEKFNLPNSKFLVTYSTEYYKLIDENDIESLFPDINIEISIDDFINGKDKVLEEIINMKS